MAPEIKSLPNMEHEFHVSVVGDTTGMKYEGNFSYRRPSLGKIRKIRCMQARLCEGQTLDTETDLLNEMISWLSFTLESAPDWFGNPFDLFDFNVIGSIWDEVLKFEDAFQSKIKKAGTKEDEKPKE